MKKYNLVLFDIDGTLLDFEQSERFALTETLKKYGLEPNDDLIECYSQINKKWWKLFEEGKVEKSEISSGRFKEFWELQGREVDPEECGRTYTDYLSKSAVLLEDATQVCREVASKVDTAIVTNGIAYVQYARIKKSGLGQFIKKVIVSEDIGAAKPDYKYFQAAMEICSHPTKDDVLIIGDSLHADIKGGIDFGIDTCWYNPEGKENADNLPITYIIKNLKELLEIIK